MEDKKGLIELNVKEADELISLLNIALKTQGFQGENAIYFKNKIVEAFNKKEDNTKE